MRFARVRVPEVALPTTALVVDGALYDVAELDRQFGMADAGGDFFERVVATRAAGLDMLEARLLAGRRPTEARLVAEDALLLPPCDPSRCVYVQLEPAPGSSLAPSFQIRDARALVGHGQPVVTSTSSPLSAEVGLAVVLADDLERAHPEEARRAVLGYTLVIDWTTEDCWERGGPQPPSQLGPVLLVSPRGMADVRERLVVEVEGQRRVTEPLDERTLAWVEALAYVSHHVSLHAGDVVGLGAPSGGRFSMPEGGRLTVELSRSLRLDGWCVVAPLDDRWRRSPSG